MTTDRFCLFQSDPLLYRVLLATIRNLGTCPCPRCEITKDQIPQVGTIPDNNRRARLARRNGPLLSGNIRAAREAIYRHGKTVRSTAVENLLYPLSFVPTYVRESEPLPFLFLFSDV